MLDEERLNAQLQERNLDMLVATSVENVFYTSGLRTVSQPLDLATCFSIWSREHGGPFLVVPAWDSDLIVDDDVDHEEVYTYGSNKFVQGDATLSETDQEVLSLAEGPHFEGPIEAFEAAIESLADEEARMALEPDGLSLSQYRTITDRISSVTTAPAEETLMALRRIKTPSEIDRLKRSVAITEAAIKTTFESLEEGMTEREAANVFRSEVGAAGADPLFCLVGFGTNSAHSAIPSDRELSAGDVIRIDAGCTYEMYQSDIARSAAFKSASDETREKYRILVDGNEEAIDAIHDGVSTSTVFDAGMEYIHREAAKGSIAELVDFERNHLGHGIGLACYDYPHIAPADAILESDMVLCVEPPYYEIGIGGLQVEDEVVVTKSSTERLSRCPESLPILD